MLNQFLKVAVAMSLSFSSMNGDARERIHELVLTNGRVMDPASGLDAVRHVAISADGRIAAVSETRPAGRHVVDVTGLVVVPGFIDFHAHGQDNEANLLQAQDGVTTALDLEGGRYPVADYYEQRAGRAILNYGVSVSHHAIRKTVWPDEDGSEDWAYAEPSAEELKRILERFRGGLRDGGIGAGLGLEYTPGAGYDEIYRIFELMAASHAPVTVHVRRARGASVAPHANIAAIQEMIANATATRAAVHIVHITPSALADTRTVLDMIAGARRAGIEVSTEVYPYTAGSTSLKSAAFDDGWQSRLEMTYSDLVWTATGERLTQESFDRYRARESATGPANVIAHFIPEAAMNHAIAHPVTQIASDGLSWHTGNEHPRGAGTFARVLGRHVREAGDLDLMTAIAKMTVMPAARLADFVPAMRRKGRIEAGADADITVFDAGRVIDRATYEDPMQPSAGIVHVFVGGIFVVKDGQPVPGVRPGKPVRLGNRGAN